MEEESKTYQKVLEHRKNCSKWGKYFCLDCFGGGLTRYTKALENEKAQQKTQQVASSKEEGA